MGKTLFELLQENGSFEITKETTIGNLNSAVVETRKDKEEFFFSDGYRKHIHDFMHVLISPVIGNIASIDENDELKVYLIESVLSFGFIEGGGEIFKNNINDLIESVNQNLYSVREYDLTNFFLKDIPQNQILRKKAELELKYRLPSENKEEFERIVKYALLISYMVQSLDESKANWVEKLPYQLMENDERKQLVLSQIIPPITLQQLEELPLQVCYDLAKYGKSQQLEKDHSLNRNQSPSEKLNLTQKQAAILFRPLN